MTVLKEPKLRVALYEEADAEAFDAQSRFEILNALLDKGFEVLDADNARSASGASSSTPSTPASAVLHLGRFKNAPPARIASESGSAGSPKGESAAEFAAEFRDISGLDADAVIDMVEEVRSQTEIKQPGSWKPWFPVIDFDRCTNCMQCLTFCLFDVYGVSKSDQIQVQNNDNCKTDCPACSRVCPEVAILFPKYGKGPINGDVVRDADIQREAMKVDISALLGGDIYASLRSRQADARKRFSTERDESRALLERKKCLKKLKSDLDIPDEVLMTLPSAGDIEERAERAKKKMAKRLARSQTARDSRPPLTQEEWGI